MCWLSLEGSAVKADVGPCSVGKHLPNTTLTNQNCDVFYWENGICGVLRSQCVHVLVRDVLSYMMPVGVCASSLAQIPILTHLHTAQMFVFF